MTPERKSLMVSVRLPAALVARADYVARNTDGEVKNRSSALRAALENWLPGQEDRLRELGILAKKTR
jgi:Arc/MetJ-type ribon-helix-helix transcriptional regulator